MKVDSFNIKIGFHLDDLFLLFRQFFLNSDFLFLWWDKVINSKSLYLFEISSNSFWNIWLCNSYWKNLDSGRPIFEIFIKRFHQLFIKFVKDIDVNFLERMLGTELIDLMVDFVCDPKLIIWLGVIKYCFEHHIFPQLINNLNFVKIDQRSIRSSTRDIFYFIGLDGHFDLNEFLKKGDTEMISRFCELFLQHSESFIDSNISLSDLMEPTNH